MSKTYILEPVEMTDSTVVLENAVLTAEDVFGDPGAGLSKNVTYVNHPYNAIERIRAKLKAEQNNSEGE